MKRNILNMLAVFVLLLACTVGFVACGKKEETKQLTAADFVGEWYVENVVYNEEGHDALSYTLAQFQDLHNRYFAGETTEEEGELYADELMFMFFKFYVKENGYIHDLSYYDTTLRADVITNENDTHACGQLSVENNEVHAIMIAAQFGASSIETVYSDGKLVVTATGTGYTTVLTLTKTVAA